MAMCMKPAAMSYASMASSCFYMKYALFHSTNVLERKRRTNWDTGGGSSKGSSQRPYSYSRRSRKMHSKHTLLRNFNEYAEYIFQNGLNFEDFFNPSSSRSTSWFKRYDHAKEKIKSNSGPHWSEWRNNRNGGYRFCFGDDDDDVEVIFRSAFGGERSTYWSFINEDSDQWTDSYNANNRRKSWKWRNKYEDDYDTDGEYNANPEIGLASDRRTLGMKASGPLNIEDVKTAYRACALKWHPDRHQGSSKAPAEEKFKKCSAAYKSLCDKLESTGPIQCV